MKRLLIGLSLIAGSAYAIHPVQFTKTVTTAGTRVQLSSTGLEARSVAVQANCNNTSNVFIGDSSVSSSNGLTLEPCKSASFSQPANSNDKVRIHNIWVDASVNGEGIRVVYLK